MTSPNGMFDCVRTVFYGDSPIEQRKHEILNITPNMATISKWLNEDWE